MHDSQAQKETLQQPYEPYVTQDDAGRIAGDYHCLHCGYNLRSLLPGGQCPECGNPIDASLPGYIFKSQNVRPLRRARFGAMLLWLGALALGASIVVIPMLFLVVEFSEFFYGYSNEYLYSIPFYSWGMLIAVLMWPGTLFLARARSLLHGRPDYRTGIITGLCLADTLLLPVPLWFPDAFEYIVIAILGLPVLLCLWIVILLKHIQAFGRLCGNPMLVEFAGQTLRNFILLLIYPLSLILIGLTGFVTDIFFVGLTGDITAGVVLSLLLLELIFGFIWLMQFVSLIFSLKDLLYIKHTRPSKP